MDDLKLNAKPVVKLETPSETFVQFVHLVFLLSLRDVGKDYRIGTTPAFTE